MRKDERPNHVLPDEDDFLLVERVLAGDRRAFEPLVRRHERRVFRVTLAVLGNIEDAEEAMQDTFVKAFRHLGQFRRESRFSTWLTRIAVNDAIQKRNTRKTFVPLAEVESAEEQLTPKRHESWKSNPEQLYGKQEIHGIVEDAIRSLPEIYREAFVLRDIEELSAEEAAEVLGITVPALKSRLLRARFMMREMLAAKFEEPPALKTKIVHAAVDVGTAVAMRLMRAAGR
ncbi:MAG: sigma-70 family RNA polymerase sigma factor [Acidobacteriia bacterium]|nr:sigma-70 family RNA polymerase sigma factor [Terriglobia bacterium]